jgi:hypothetical protein
VYTPDTVCVCIQLILWRQYRLHGAALERIKEKIRQVRACVDVRGGKVIHALSVQSELFNHACSVNVIPMVPFKTNI